MPRVVPGLVLLCVALGCQKSQRAAPPPPNAQRPQIKTEAELSAERDQRVRSGQIVPTSVPVVPGTERATPVRRPQPIVRPVPGAIEADVLLINSTALTVAEVLYPLWPELTQIRQTQTPAGFQDRAGQLIRRQTQQEIGSLLVYAEATAKFDDSARKALDEQVRKEIDNYTARDFGGSATRLTAHLTEHGLTLDQLKTRVARDLAVREYTRERLMPQVQVRRDEFLAFYRDNASRYATAEMRELLVIELPFAKFLPEGQTWDRASAGDQAQARVKAARRAREAYDALTTRPFDEVAREASLGLHAAEGGSWGLISRPLQPPYDEVSRLIFQYEPDQYGEPMETPTGWCIVKCGQVQAAKRRSFEDVQDEIRGELMDSRFTKLSMDYVLRLAEKATVSALDPFVAAALKRAEKGTATAVSTSAK